VVAVADSGRVMSRCRFFVGVEGQLRFATSSATVECATSVTSEEKSRRLRLRREEKRPRFAGARVVEQAE